ncbi:lysozyme [Burkholderia gladioli]|uniref:lysozyme n=1 Tax=Burkholderia gladioli TaxID=28095 RepID=UPI001641ABC8|nr:lysozyme [Burkholderia gladioli]
MGLSDILRAIFAAFGRTPERGYTPVAAGPLPAPPVPSQPAAQPEPSPKASEPVAVPPVAPAVPVPPVPVQLTPADPEWLALARPLSCHFERCYLRAYPDPASPLGRALQKRGLWYRTLAGEPIPYDGALALLSGKPWTVGWGSTGDDIHEGTVLTQAEADARHDANLNTSAAIVDGAVRVQLSPQQKAAMVLIVNNVGPGRAARDNNPGRSGIVVLANGQPSTLLRKLNIGDYAGAADQFPAWNLAGGIVEPGLVARRKAERDLFLTGKWSAT